MSSGRSESDSFTVNDGDCCLPAAGNTTSSALALCVCVLCPDEKTICSFLFSIKRKKKSRAAPIRAACPALTCDALQQHVSRPSEPRQNVTNQQSQSVVLDINLFIYLLIGCICPSALCPCKHGTICSAALASYLHPVCSQTSPSLITV